MSRPDNSRQFRLRPDDIPGRQPERPARNPELDWIFETDASRDAERARLGLPPRPELRRKPRR